MCSENEHCHGCNSGECPDKEWCENRKCSLKRGIDHCYRCETDCRLGLLTNIKPYGFTKFARKYGLEHLLDCLERNEHEGVVYHRQGIVGDYDEFDEFDEFDDVDELMAFIQTGRR